MAIRITAIRLSGGDTYQHIVRLWWTNPATGAEDNSTREAIVDWIENQDGKAYVEEGGRRVEVGVFTSANGTKYLRTYADGYWNNNLLSLPRK